MSNLRRKNNSCFVAWSPPSLSTTFSIFRKLSIRTGDSAPVITRLPFVLDQLYGLGMGSYWLIIVILRSTILGILQSTHCPADRLHAFLLGKWKDTWNSATTFSLVVQMDNVEFLILTELLWITRGVNGYHVCFPHKHLTPMLVRVFKSWLGA